MAFRSWSRDELLAAFNLYCRTPFGRLHARNPEIVHLAQRLGRTASSLAMKCCNFAALDPQLRKRGIRGLGKVSQRDKLLWQEFERNPEEIAYESETTLARLCGSQPRMVGSIDWQDVHGLDRVSVMKVRVNQYLFRCMIISGYREACAVCALPTAGLLVASHIVAWAIDPSNRMNPRNGLCLCAIHDKAYDCGLFLIRADYTIAVTEAVRRYRHNEAVKMYFLRFDGKSINLPDRWQPDPALLERHAEILGIAN